MGKVLNKIGLEQSLQQKRASLAKAYLTSRGITGKRIMTRALGESVLAYSNTYEAS